MFSFVFLSMIFLDFIFVDFDKILDNFIYLFGNFWGNYFLPTLHSRYGNVTIDILAVVPLQRQFQGLSWSTT